MDGVTQIGKAQRIYGRALGARGGAGGNMMRGGARGGRGGARGGRGGGIGFGSTFTNIIASPDNFFVECK